MKSRFGESRNGFYFIHKMKWISRLACLVPIWHFSKTPYIAIIRTPNTIKMNRFIPKILLLTALCFCFASQGFAQKSKYQGIQGLGYLHTQVTILIENWETHPLSENGLDVFEEEYKQHFLEEIEHDEEWVEFMLVEDNLLFQFDSHIDAEVEEAIEHNLAFYHKVVELIKDPESMGASLDELKGDLQEADSNLYDIIYPAICK